MKLMINRNSGFDSEFRFWFQIPVLIPNPGFDSEFVMIPDPISVSVPVPVIH